MRENEKNLRDCVIVPPGGASSKELKIIHFKNGKFFLFVFSRKKNRIFRKYFSKFISQVQELISIERTQIRYKMKKLSLILQSVPRLLTQTHRLKLSQKIQISLNDPWIQFEMLSSVFIKHFYFFCLLRKKTILQLFKERVNRAILLI